MNLGFSAQALHDRQLCSSCPTHYTNPHTKSCAISKTLVLCPRAHCSVHKPLATSRQVAINWMLTEMPQGVTSPEGCSGTGLTSHHLPGSCPCPVLQGLTGPGSQEAPGAFTRSCFSRVAARCRQPSTHPGLCGAGGAGTAGAEPGAGGLGEPAGPPWAVPDTPGPSRTGCSVISSTFPPAGAPHTRIPLRGSWPHYPPCSPGVCDPPLHPACSRG